MTATLTPPAADDRKPFATANPADLRDLAQMLRDLGIALATGMTSALEVAATRADELADAREAAGTTATPSTNELVREALAQIDGKRRSVADFLAFAAEPEPAEAKTVAEPEPIPVDAPAVTPEPTRPPTIAEREAAKRVDHGARVEAARELLARALEPGDDALALLATVADLLRTMPRAEFGRTHTRRRGGDDKPDVVEDLWHALNARAARVAVAAHAAGATPRTITDALGVPVQHWFSIRDAGEAAGPIRRDLEFGPWIAATRQARGLS